MPAVAIVPTYRNRATLPQVLQELCAAGLPVIAVDDGSEDGTREFLALWSGQGPGRTAIARSANGGKARALLDGLEAAAAAGHDIALTVDADGQHLVADALRVLQAAGPDALVCGARDATAPTYPWASLLGRRIWSLGVRSLTGIGVSDPVCGLRAYPVAAMQQIRCVSGRYAWEEEALVRAAWRGVQIRQVDVHTVYAPPETRVSHYRIGRDWGESLRVYARLAGARLAFRDGARARSAHATSPRRRPDASFWWLVGAAIMVGFTLGALVNPWIALPLACYIGQRAHAGAWLMPLVAAAGAAVCIGWSPLAAIGAAATVDAGLAAAALMSLRWAQSRDSS